MYKIHIFRCRFKNNSTKACENNVKVTIKVKQLKLKKIDIFSVNTNVDKLFAATV